MEANHPILRGFFDVQDLPVVVKDWSHYVLHVPWLQDPVQYWSPGTYRYANRLAGRCDALKIPIINRVDRLLNTTKLIGSRIMQNAGLNVPKMAAIKDTKEFKDTLLGLRLPLFVREDWGHWGEILSGPWLSSLSMCAIRATDCIASTATLPWAMLGSATTCKLRVNGSPEAKTA